MWLPIHVQFFADGLLFMLLLGVVILSYSMVAYALVKETGFNVLLAVVFHLAINLGNLLILSIIHQPALMLVNALVWLAIVVATVLMKRDLFFGHNPSR